MKKILSKNAQFYYKNNRLQQLRGFCYAAQFGNITRAGEHMGLAQSTVSLQIKSLEDELNVKLFQRNGPRIVLTRDGEDLLNLALPHVDGVENICEKFIHERSITNKTEIVVGVNSSTKNYLMPHVVNEYVQKYDHINVTLHFVEQDKVAKMIEHNDLDCAVLPRRPHKPFPKTCEYTPIYFFKPCLITRKDHPLARRQHLTIKEISEYDVILPDYELRVIPNLYDSFDLEKVQKKRRVNFVGMETGREFIDAGLIITISSSVFVRLDDPSLVATPLPHLFDDVDYGFVTKKGKALSQNLANLISIARKHSKKLME